MNINKKETKKQIIALCSLLLIVIALVGIMYIVNIAYAATTDIGTEDVKTYNNAKINFGNTTTSNNINFDVELKDNSKAIRYYLDMTFKLTQMREALFSSTVVLDLQVSTDNASWTSLVPKTLTKNDVGKTITFSTDYEQTTSKVYYRLLLTVNDQEQDIRNQNIAGEYDVKLAKGYYYTWVDPESLPTDVGQEWEAPAEGDYRVELWGGQGNWYFASITKPSGRPGFGAYTAGSFHLKEGQKLYFYIGKGGYSGSDKYNVINFNGGGIGAGLNKNPSGSMYHYSGAGGGAADVRLVSGNWDDAESLVSRIMVAGGGGGANNAFSYNNKSLYDDGCSGQGGSAGGLIGYIGKTGGMLNVTARMPQGGTQTSGGSKSVGAINSNGAALGVSDLENGAFGVAGRFPVVNVGIGGGGGGGWYGGAGGTHNTYTYVETRSLVGQTLNTHTGGAGGSSYISGHTGCVSYENRDSCETGTSDKNCSLSGTGFSFYDTVMIDGEGYSWTNEKGGLTPMPNPNGGYFESGTGNTGDGAAKITMVNPAEVAESIWKKTQSIDKVEIIPDIDRPDDGSGKVTNKVTLNNKTEDIICGGVMIIPIDERLYNITDVKMNPSDIAKYEVQDKQIIVTFSDTIEPNGTFTITYLADEHEDVKNKDTVDLDPVFTYYPSAVNECAEDPDESTKKEITGHDDIPIPLKVPDTGLFISVGGVAAGIAILSAGIFLLKKKPNKSNL